MAGIGSSSSSPRRDGERSLEQAHSHEQLSKPGGGTLPQHVGSSTPTPSSASSLQDVKDGGPNFAAIVRAASPKPTATSATAGLTPKSAVGISLGQGGGGSKGTNVSKRKTPTAEQIGYMEKAKEAKAAKAAEAEAARLASIPEERPPKAEVPERRTPTPAGEKTAADTRLPVQARDKMSLFRSAASFSPRGSKEFPEDSRQRSLMEARPTPLMSHTVFGLAPYERASLWSAENRNRARFEVESHGGRPVPGGWPRLSGKPEKKMAEAVRDV